MNTLFKQLLEGATPGPWKSRYSDVVTEAEDGRRGPTIICAMVGSPGHPQVHADHLLIARCNPTTMRAVLEALEKQKAVNDALFGHCLSNGVFNSRGYSFDCTEMNHANLLTDKALAALNGETT